MRARIEASVEQWLKTENNNNNRVTANERVRKNAQDASIIERLRLK